MEFERCWLLALGTCQHPLVDLTGLTFVDAAGKKLLQEIHTQGAKLVGTGLMTKSLIEELTGAKEEHPLPVGKTKGGALKIILLLLLPLLCAGAPLRAQQDPGTQSGEPSINRGGLPVGSQDASGPAPEKPPQRLSLRQAVSLALKENPQVQIATLNVAQSQEDHTIARSALLPRAGMEVLDQAMRFNIDAEFGSKFPGIPQHAGPFQYFQAGPSFSMPVLDLTLWRRWQAAHQGVNASQAQETTVREQVTLMVVSQYLSGMRANAAVKAARSRVELAQALYDQAQDLQTHGVGTGIDTLRANVELQNEKQRLLEAETQQKVALYGLARLLNLDPRQEIELTDSPSFYETPQYESEQSLEQAYANRPEMTALAAQARIAEVQKRSASESRLPSIKVVGNWGYIGLSAPSAIPSYIYQLSVDVPLFTGGRIRAEQAKAGQEIRKVAQQRTDLRNQIALEVKTALAELESARHEVDVANQGVRLASEEVTQARDRFQAGVANNIEVISAQDALARANDNQIVALYRYNQARADLAHAIGQMEALYAQ
jgi:outer membrane protein TolC